MAEKKNYLEKLEKGKVRTLAKEYIDQRRLKKAFDKVADRLEFIEEIEQLQKDLDEVKAYMEWEIEQIDQGKLPKERVLFDVVKKIKGYAVFDWVKLVKQWKSEQ